LKKETRLKRATTLVKKQKVLKLTLRKNMSSSRAKKKKRKRLGTNFLSKWTK